MAEKEKESIGKSNRQIDETQETLPNYATLQYSLLEQQNILVLKKDDYSEMENEVKSDQNTNNYAITENEKDNEFEQKISLMANNPIEMRLTVLASKKKAVKKEEIKHSKDDIVVVDNNRSIVTVRGEQKTEPSENDTTAVEQDNINNKIAEPGKENIEKSNEECKTAGECLYKSEKACDKNARKLLEQVLVARVPNQKPEPIENDTKAVEQDNISKEEESERMLNKAKKLDPSLDLEEKLSLIKTAKPKQIIEDKKSKEEIEKSNEECKTAGECLYKSKKAHDKSAVEPLKQVQAAGIPKEKPEPIENDTKAEKQVSTVKEKMSIIKVDPVNATRSLEVFEKAFTTGNLEKAERMLKKAKRFDPSLNVEEKLSLVKVAKNKKIIEENGNEKIVPKEKPEPIENATEAVEQDNTIKEEGSIPEGDSMSADKCLTAFENAFATGKLEKAERMLKKAKRFDPLLNVEEKLSLVKAAISNKITEEKRKEKIEKANRECKTASECLYEYLKAYTAGNLQNAKRFLLQAKILDPALNLESELSEIRTKINDSFR